MEAAVVAEIKNHLKENPKDWAYASGDGCPYAVFAFGKVWELARPSYYGGSYSIMGLGCKGKTLYEGKPVYYSHESHEINGQRVYHFTISKEDFNQIRSLMK